MDDIKPSLLDRVVGAFSPERAARRMAFRALTGSSGWGIALDRIKNLAGKSPYYRGSRKGRLLGDWVTDSGTANEHIKVSLDDLRNDSNDLVANNAIAGGAIDTYVTNVVGTGIVPFPAIDYQFLGMTEDEAEKWQDTVEREFKLFAKTCDCTRTRSFAEITGLILRSYLTNGDVFCNLPMLKRDGIVYETALNLIEGHRISTKIGLIESPTLIMGVELDENGTPEAYQYSSVISFGKALEWRTLKAFDDKGNPLILHIFRKKRVDQNRGIPILAPIIELVKKLDTYSQAEVTAAVINSFFTVFIKKRAVDDDNALDVVSKLGGETGAKSTDDDLALGEGNIVELLEDEDGIDLADPKRPNVNFENFFKAVVSQIALGLNLPFEVLLKQFQSSYSASKGAVIEATKVFDEVERFLVDSFCQPVYEAFLFEAVTTGRIAAPGFTSDPLIRQAYSIAEWVGPAQNELDPVKGAKAAEARIANGTSNVIIETAKSGRDYARVVAGAARAKRIRDRAQLTQGDDDNANS